MELIKLFPLTVELQKLLALHHVDDARVLRSHVLHPHPLAVLALHSRYFYFMGEEERGRKVKTWNKIWKSEVEGDLWEAAVWDYLDCGSSWLSWGPATSHQQMEIFQQKNH